jgi:hypothetical protein
MNTNKILKTAGGSAQSVSEKVIAGKKYKVRSVCTGISKKNVREALLELAERKVIREMGL